MAVEIKEIVIRAVLNPGDQTNQTAVPTDQDREAIVQECVSQVMKILNKKNRR